MTREQIAFALTVLLIGMFSIAGAAVTMEPGWIAAAEQGDLQRLQDLNEIAAAVMQFKARHSTLPYDASILAESQPADHPLQFNDPDSKQAYEYARIDESTYRLCAVFALESAPVNMWAPIVRALPESPPAHGAYGIRFAPATPMVPRFSTSSPALAGPFPQNLPPAFQSTFQRAAASPWGHPAGAHCYKFKDRTTLPLQDGSTGETKS